MNPTVLLVLAAAGLGVAAFFLGKDAFPSTPAGTLMKAVGYKAGKPYDLWLKSIGQGHYLIPDAADAYNAMAGAALASGLTFKVNESFRTASRQESLYARLGSYLTGGLASTPGYSPHQQGIAVDISVGSGDKRGAPGTNAVWFWLVANARLYGFVNDLLLHPGTGEAWHWQWTGTPGIA